MGIDCLGIVSIPKKSKNKQIFIDWVRNDQVRNDRVRSDRVRNDRVRNDRIRNDWVRNDRVRNDWVTNDRVTNDRGLEMIGSPKNNYKLFYKEHCHRS